MWACTQDGSQPHLRPTTVVELRYLFLTSIGFLLSKLLAPLSHTIFVRGRAHFLARATDAIAADLSSEAVNSPSRALSPTQIRVLSWNVSEGVGIDGDNQLSGLFQAVIESRADAVVLQSARTLSPAALSDLQVAGDWPHMHRGPAGLGARGFRGTVTVANAY